MSEVGLPEVLVAELTYRCNMHCWYCYNPEDLSEFSAEKELSTDEWKKVIREASELGVFHVHITGGEPTIRQDLPSIVEEAKNYGLYVNLITNITLYDRKYWEDLIRKGVDHVQVSFQAHTKALNDLIGEAQTYEKKLKVLSWLKETGVFLTMNIVLHRWNIDYIEDIIQFVHDLGIPRFEIAMLQFGGWDWKNRLSLIPNKESVEKAYKIAQEYKERLKGEMNVTMVALDIYEGRPKPCTYGWGNKYIVVNPIGDVLPCHGAKVIKTLSFDNVRERSLADIWYNSEAFNKFRGFDWMNEPCRSCPEREKDFGGCRCFSYMLTGKADVTDPSCEFSPYRYLVDKLIEDAGKDVFPIKRGTIKWWK
jgi:pyrroloquinoline quinone biosynthesis protein E